MAADLLARGLAATARDGAMPLLRRFADLPSLTLPRTCDRFEAGAGAERGGYVADDIATAALAAAHPLFCKADAAGRRFRLLADPDGLVDVRQAGNMLLAGLGDNKALVRACIAYVIATKAAGTRGIRFPAGTYDLYSGVRTTDPDVLDDPTGHVLVIAGAHVVFKGSGVRQTTLRQRSPAGFGLLANWQVVAGKVFRGCFFNLVESVAEPATLADRSGITLEDITIDGGNPYNQQGPHQGQGGAIYPASTATGLGWDNTHQGIRAGFNHYQGAIELRRCHLMNFGGEAVYHSSSHNLGITIDDYEASYCGGTGLNPAGWVESFLEAHKVYIHHCLGALEGYCGNRGRLTGLVIENCWQAGNLNAGGHTSIPQIPAGQTTTPRLSIEGEIINSGAFYGTSWTDLKLRLTDSFVIYDFSGVVTQGGAEGCTWDITHITDRVDALTPVTIAGGTSANTLSDTRFRIKLMRTAAAREADRQALQPVQAYGHIGPGVVVEHSGGEAQRRPNDGNNGQSGYPILYHDCRWQPGLNSGAWDNAAHVSGVAGAGAATVPIIGDYRAYYLTSGTRAALKLATANVKGGARFELDFANLGADQGFTLANFYEDSTSGLWFPDGRSRLYMQYDKAFFEFDPVIGGGLWVLKDEQVRVRTLTVATLPAAANRHGAIAWVGDATVTQAAGVGTVVAGGGANTVRVGSNNTNWIIL